MTTPSRAATGMGGSLPDAATRVGRGTWSRRETIHRGANRESEQGDIASSLIILPLVLLAIALCIQAALVMHANNVANAAAQDGLKAAQLDGATAGNGKVAAENTLALFGGIEAAKVTVTRTDDTVTVQIEGEVAVPLNGVFNSFDVSATGPVERFYLESERQP